MSTTLIKIYCDGKEAKSAGRVDSCDLICCEVESSYSSVHMSRYCMPNDVKDISLFSRMAAVIGSKEMKASSTQKIHFP